MMIPGHRKMLKRYLLLLRVGETISPRCYFRYVTQFYVNIRRTYAAHKTGKAFKWSSELDVTSNMLFAPKSNKHIATKKHPMPGGCTDLNDKTKLQTKKATKCI